MLFRFIKSRVVYGPRLEGALTGGSALTRDTGSYAGLLYSPINIVEPPILVTRGTLVSNQGLLPSGARSCHDRGKVCVGKRSETTNTAVENTNAKGMLATKWS